MDSIQKIERKSNHVTPREIEVVKELAEGKSTKEIAASLGITVNTVEVHRYRIINKTGASTFTQAIVLMVRGGII